MPSEPAGASGARPSSEIVWREVGATARAAGAMRCPKCDDEQPKAPACRRCGLAAGHFESFRDSGGYELPEAAAKCWRRCVERWDDAKAHEEFADRVAAAGAFAAAARAYRERLRRDPDDEVARAQLDRLRRMAEAAAFAAAPSSHKAERGREPYRAVVWLLVFFALLAMAGAFYGVLTGDGGSRAPEPIDGPLRLEGGGAR